MTSDYLITALQPVGLREQAEDISCSFREAKPDSLVCRMPKSLVVPYLEEVIADGGTILVARGDKSFVGFLVFVRDNNLSLAFLRRHRIRVGLGLLLSPKIQDKRLLLEAAVSAIRMRGADLPREFENEISLLAVKPDFTGRGIGALLVERLLKTRRGEVKVKTTTANRGAIRFYKRMGFVESGQIKVGARTLACFTKTLPPREAVMLGMQLAAPSGSDTERRLL